MTKKELLFLADAAESYRNRKVDDWVLPSCPISEKNRKRVEVIERLPKKILKEYG